MTAAALNTRIAEALANRAETPVMAFTRRSGADALLTGAAMEAAVAERAVRLRDWLGPGRRVVLAMPKDEECILLLLACFRAGVGVVPVAVPRRGSKLDRFAYIVEDSAAAAVICAADQRDTIAEAMQGAGACPIVTAPLSGDLPPPPALKEAAREAVIQYTSGSTRLPKGVLIGGDNILANADLVSRAWGMDENARFVSWLPQFHDMGLMGGILYPLLCGGFSAQMPPHDFIRKPLAWLEAIHRYRANFSGGPAFGFAEILRRVPPAMLEGLDLSSWSRAFCGAEPVPATLGLHFSAHLAPAGFPATGFFACYGMAEMTLFAAGVPGQPAAQGTGPTQPCLLNAETRSLLRIVDPATGAELPPGSEGEIQLCGASKGAGYLGIPEESRKTFGATAADWLATGDLGQIQGENLFVTGRLKDLVICHGRNIAAPEIEWLAAQVHGGLDPMAAAAFSPDPRVSGEVVIVAERTRRDEDPDPVEGLRHVAQAIAGEWGLALNRLIILPRGRLPRTTSGKVRRAAVAQAYRAGEYDIATEGAESP